MAAHHTLLPTVHCKLQAEAAQAAQEEAAAAQAAEEEAAAAQVAEEQAAAAAAAANDDINDDFLDLDLGEAAAACRCGRQ